MRATPLPQNNLDQRVETALALITKAFHKRLTLYQIARVVNLSTSRLRHLFKAKTGMTPTQYIKLVRLKKAMELAECTFLSVKQIMARVGLKDESHFVRDFKKIYGITITKYRTCPRVKSR